MPDYAKEYEFDLALSFAGEDRDTVKRLARALRRLGVNVFYDEDFSAELWGKTSTNTFKQFTETKPVFVSFLSPSTT